MESAEWHQKYIGMVLLIVGKQHCAPYSKGHFMTFLMEEYVKMASAIGRAKPFCACMAHKGVDAASQMTGQLLGVTNGVLDTWYT